MHQVSRKFVYQQGDKAQRSLDETFAPSQGDDDVLFHLPVTKNWLYQLILGLVLIGHSSHRGVVDLLRDLFEWKQLHRRLSDKFHGLMEASVTRSKRPREPALWWRICTLACAITFSCGGAWVIPI